MAAALEANPYQIELQTLGGDEEDDDEVQPVSDDEDGPTGAELMESEDNKARSLRVRMIMCASAIGLLFLTSWTLATAVSSSFFEPPSLNQSWTLWKDAALFANQERIAFETCTEDASWLCDSLLNTSRASELERVSERKAKNSRYYDTLVTKNSDCTLAQVQVFFALKIWSRVLTKEKKVVKYKNGCTGDDLVEFRAAVENRSLAVETQALSLTNKFASDVKKLISQTHESFGNMSSYTHDYARNTGSYLAGEAEQKLKDITGLEDIGINVSDIFPSDTFDGLQGVADKMSTSLNSTRNKLQSGFDKTQKTLEEQQKYLVEMKDKMRDQISTLTTGFENAKDTVWQCCLSVATNVLDIDDFPLWNKNLDTNLEFNGSFANMFDKFDNLVGKQFDFDVNITAHMDKLKAEMEEAKKKAQEEANAYNEKVKKQMESVHADLTSRYNLTELFADYNPPPLILEDGTEVDDDNENFTNSLFAKFNGIDNIENKPESSGFFNKSLQYFDKIDIPRTSFNFNFEQPSGDPAFDNVLSVFGAIAGAMLWSDWLYRVWRSVSLFIRYWSNSAVGLPIIDVRKFRETKKVPLGVKIGLILQSPWFLAIVLGLLLFVIISMVGSFYVPMMNNHRAGCVDSGTDTWTVKNGYSLFYNLATSTGNKEAQKCVSVYDAKRGEECVQLGGVTYADYQKMVTSFEETKFQTREILRMLQLTDKCWDYSNFVETDSNGYTYYTFALERGLAIPTAQFVSELISENQCGESAIQSFNVSELQDSSFQCSGIPTCFHCDACNVKEGDIYFKVRNAGCTSERMILMGITQFGMNFVIWICWNVGRWWLFAGISRILWKILTPRGFNYVGSCDRAGQVDGKTRNDVPPEVEKAIKRFEGWGWRYIIAAVFLQGLWAMTAPLIAKNYFS
eukprot:CAMPEP_0175128920 /NCGR_PEP_ID=MMETSP0087-20121206/5190_1 /TAXON_ID=136419 /ORGANISM="Unknown Unknown, Strain D1" /LENGTH=908 /DNA_ID=CAMNT_0016411023 /DNA_START=9 /DNA_END=2735 /DNA_ORIENTATION=-